MSGKGLHDEGVPVDMFPATALFVPVAVVAIWFVVRRIRRQYITAGEQALKTDGQLIQTVTLMVVLPRRPGHEADRHDDAHSAWRQYYVATQKRCSVFGQNIVPDLLIDQGKRDGVFVANETLSCSVSWRNA